ncbi:MAG: hypothetical protein L0Z50_29215, partial [Verrucomicrobiales bacterium]|nr:hypothetical protein [Verrucomicrobiales bacterium]
MKPSENISRRWKGAPLHEPTADGPRPQPRPHANAYQEIHCFPGVRSRCDRGPVAIRFRQIEPQIPLASTMNSHVLSDGRLIGILTVLVGTCCHWVKRLGCVSVLAISLTIWLLSAQTGLGADAAQQTTAAAGALDPKIAGATAQVWPQDQITLGQQFLFSYLTAFMFFLSICLGSLFLVLLHHLFDASWSVPTRRFLEHIASSVWMLGVLFIPILLFAHRLYR